MEKKNHSLIILSFILPSSRHLSPSFLLSLGPALPHCLPPKTPAAVGGEREGGEGGGGGGGGRQVCLQLPPSCCHSLPFASASPTLSFLIAGGFFHLKIHQSQPQLYFLFFLFDYLHCFNLSINTLERMCEPSSPIRCFSLTAFLFEFHQG